MAETKRSNKKASGRKSSSARYSSTRKKKKQNSREMPRWLHILIAASVAGMLLFVAYHLFLKENLFRFAVCDGQKAFQTCLPKGYDVFGIDISHHQGSINWKKLKQGTPDAPPISFVYMKATEGSSHVDKRYNDNWRKAKSNSFTRGAYHYFSTKSSGEKQANMFISKVKLEPGDLPPMIDIEETPSDKQQFIAELKTFILKIEEHYGVKPIIYSYAKFYNKYLKDEFFQEYDLWVAHYYVKDPAVKREWKMWQFTDIGRIPGIKEKTDINTIAGGAKALEELLIK